MKHVRDNTELRAFLERAHSSESVEQAGARDRVFRRYGDIEHVFTAYSCATVSLHPDVPNSQGESVGYIGHMVLGPDASDFLAAAHQWLKAKGAKVVRGPVVRHTWYPFRAVTDGFARWPRLTGEPWNEPRLPAQLEAAGYGVHRRYLTTYTNQVMQVEQSEAKLRTFQESGFALRTLDPSNLAADLVAIHQLIHESFKPPQNTMFVPIDLEEFLLVLGVTPDARSESPIDPFWVRLCVAPDGTTAGFIFMTREGDLASVKTLCVSPRFGGLGLGGALVALGHRIARSAGVSWVAHTLMSDTGPSMSITAAGGHEVLRRYALYERAL